MIKTLQMLVVAIASAATTAYILDLRNDQNIVVQPQHELAALHDEIAQLNEKNAQLNSLLNNKGPMADIHSQTQATAQQLAPSQSKSSPYTTEEKPIALAETQPHDDKLLRKSENFSKWLSNSYKEKGSFSLQEEMQQRFNTEVIDPEWAEAQEQEYLTMFDNSPELAGLALRETQCRSQQCALTISISDINQANTLLDKMTATFKQQNKYPMIIATPDEQRGVTTLYIAKDENSFEFN